jgi:preprotein translocase subunit SecE
MNILAYLKESYTELVHKVSWPSWSELQASGIVVMIASLIIATIISLMDLIFQYGVNIIYGIF